MDAPRFPLMRLPLAGSQNVLRILKPIQIFGISLASKKSKGLVQSLRIKPLKFIVRINNGFLIRLRFSNATLYFLYFQSIANLREFSVCYEDIQYRCSLNELDGRMFINHLMFIFNTEKLSIEYGFNSEQFDFVPVFKGRRDIEDINFIFDNPEENRKILNIIKPPMASMATLPSRDILLQNFDTLVGRAWKFSLNDLVLMNSRRLEGACSMISPKLLNRFLKLWMRGSNPQLESLAICFGIDQNFKQEEIFAGLKVTQNNTTRYFKSVSGRYTRTDGLDIFRFDGMTATIWAKRVLQGTIFFFELLVWHDHCIATEADYNR